MKYLSTAEIIVFIMGAENCLDFLTSEKKWITAYIYAQLFKIRVIGPTAFYNYVYKWTRRAISFYTYQHEYLHW